MSKKLTYEYVKNFIEVESNSGCKLLSENYNKNSQKLILKCKCSEIFNTSYKEYLNGKRQCNKCGEEIRINKKRFKFEYVKEYIESFGYTLLTNEYTSIFQKLDIKCPNGHDISTDFNSFKNANTRCMECYLNEISINPEVILSFLENIGYKFIRWLDENKRITSRSKFIVECSNGHQLKRTWNEIQQGHRCRKCSTGVDGEYVYNQFILKGLIPKFEPNEYINARIPLNYLCPDHDFEIQTICYDSLRRGSGCKYCARERTSGENHHNWNGGTSKLATFLRYTSIIQWKKDSAKNCNYKCILTGKNFDVIHHLYSFNNILKELLKEYKLSKKDMILSLDNSLLKELSEKCLNLHYKYGLGVCLCKELHTLFHHLYGRGKTTPEQFEEFKIRLKCGEFNDFLKENRLTIII